MGSQHEENKLKQTTEANKLKQMNISNHRFLAPQN